MSPEEAEDLGWDDRFDMELDDDLSSLLAEKNRLRAALEEIKSYSSMVRKSNILSSPFEDRTRRDIWVKARYEVGKKIYEMARAALGDTNA